ncbi:MAG TPA: cupin domain-containing protein [Caulobacteraceae bacterium]|jgi:quercetin dioxygenase-like cupin family protein
MKASVAVMLALALSAPAQVHAQSRAPSSERQMEISRNGARPSAEGPAAWFTGSVRIDPLFDPEDPARAGAAIVTFEPGARTAWHRHPLGQRLIVTSGLGLTQVEGGPVEELRPGDVVWCPPNVRHWHGATATTAMTHIAVQEALDGRMVEWLEHVSDDQVRRRQ